MLCGTIANIFGWDAQMIRRFDLDCMIYGASFNPNIRDAGA